MDLISVYGKEIVSLLVPLVTWILNGHFKNKAKLLFGQLHEFTFLINEPLYNVEKEKIKDNQLVNTRSLIIINGGKETASKVEIIFNWKPMYMNIWPVKHYESYNEADDRYVIVFDYLSPKEESRIEVLSVNSPLPELLSVRAKECVGKNISLIYQRDIKPLLKQFILLLLFIGVAAFTYIVIILLQWLITKTV